MKRIFVSIFISLLFTVILSGCQSQIQPQAKIVNPQAPFLDDNINVMNEYAEKTVDRSADASGRAARLPFRFFNVFRNRVKGISDANPYARSEPYFRDDFKQAQAAQKMEGVTQPEYLRGERYANTYRSPFIFREELERGGTSEMTTVQNVSSSLLAKQYLEYQDDLEAELKRAQKLYDEQRYSEALEVVDKVMDMDTSSYEGRILFEKIIKAREEARINQEKNMRERVAKHEKVSRYLSEAKEYLEANNLLEAERVSQKALSIDPTHQGAREFADNIEMAKFELKLKASGTSSLEMLEKLIYKHLQLYQQYSNENLKDLAEKELRKVAILESYRDKVEAVKQQ
ncbi:MAG: hypothetical protein KKH94_03695 [Candidatus Omnitrophica bacterium]|nr:hypothetical protein [Candidatus Omnitrophota bacterium]